LWRGRSRRAKARILFYPALVASAVGGVTYMTAMPGQSHRGGLAPLDDAGRARADALRADVVALVGGQTERSQRVAGTLERAERHITGALTGAGYAVSPLAYESNGARVVNLEATLAGKDPGAPLVIVGAHYDSASGAPGADDNASGVAATLAIARALAAERWTPSRTIRFVAFVNEEPPFFWNEEMGSLVYAKACKAKGERVAAMLSLETLGYFADGAGTQKYPPVVSWFYPDRGDFVGFVGNTASRSLVRESIGAFRASARFPSEGAALPGFVAGVGWSDHWSFWQMGYPAVMVTDTAPFRNPHYHQATDLPETLDYDRLSRVVDGLVAVVKKLAE
jgi:Zn-dependent M28 family amino/carboxypeptidase